MEDVAVAVFAKTPGVTPAKTRLAKTIGTERAEQFYLYCLEAISHLSNSPQYDFYWAINEKDQGNNEFWSSRNTIYQGDGNLGDKLAKVYSELKKRYKTIILIGTDLPSLKQSDLLIAIDHLRSNNICVGPSTDGGFYLFASKLDINEKTWLDVPYSTDNTLKSLMAGFSEEASLLEARTDVDEFDDLMKLYRDTKDTENKALIKIRRLVESLLPRKQT